MNVIVLTTDTIHHRYYCARLAEQAPLRGIFLETRSIHFPFETAHPFEQRRDEYERGVLLGGEVMAFDQVTETRVVESMNHGEAVAALREMAPDVLLVFGTGKLDPAVFETASVVALNLHGGNPEHYRGLDTHLWAIYHGEFGQLVTTLHYLAEALDTGPVVFQAQLPLERGMGIHQLRAVNTEVCVQMSRLALQALESGTGLPTRRQVGLGRYYSAMPAVLKETCVRRFERHVENL